MAGRAWLTVKEAADALGIGLKLMYALLSAGKIPHARHGLGRGTIRVRAADLDAYLCGAMVDGRTRGEGASAPAPRRRSARQAPGVPEIIDPRKSGRLLG